MYCIIITEANQKVATGHLLEACELIDELQERAHQVYLLINEDCPNGLLSRIHCTYSFFRDSLHYDIISVIEQIKAEDPDVVVTDMRKIENEDILTIKSRTEKKMFVIDELGHRRLDADVIINPMIAACFWDYPNSKGVKFFGQDYLALPRKLRAYHIKEKPIRSKIKNICISMGGVDLYGTTVKLVKWLSTIFHDVQINCVLGVGFLFSQELRSTIESLPPNNQLHVMKNIHNIYEYFYEADLAFCAGGNTLHELACIGVPTIVIPTMDHELRNGQAYASRGFGICLSKSEEITAGSIESSIAKMLSKEYRKKMSRNGKMACDGMGCKRTAEIIEGE